MTSLTAAKSTSTKRVMKALPNFVHLTGINDGSPYDSRYTREITRPIRYSTQNEYTYPPDHVRAVALTQVLQSVKTLDLAHNAHHTSTHPKTVFSADSKISLTPFLSDLQAQISSSVTIDTFLYPTHVSFGGDIFNVALAFMLLSVIVVHIIISTFTSMATKCALLLKMYPPKETCVGYKRVSIVIELEI